MRYSFPFVLIALMVLAGCGGYAPDDTVIEEIDGVTYVRNGSRIDTTNFPYRFVLEQTFGVENEPAEEILGGADFLEVDDAGNVYVLINHSHRLVSFGANGSLRWSRNQAGEGPGELRDPWGMTLVDDSMLVFGNQGSAGIDFWTTDGAFFERRPKPEGIGFMNGVAGYTPRGKLIMSSNEMYRLATQLSYLDRQSWKVTDSLRVVQPFDREVIPGYIFGPQACFWPDAVFFGSILGDYRIEQYDYSGQLKRVIIRDVDFLPGFGMYKADRGSDVTLGSKIQVLEPKADGQFLAFVTWLDIPDPDEFSRQEVMGEDPDAQRMHSLDAFDAQGRYIASMTSPAEEFDLGKPFRIKDGYLYTSVSSPFPQVRRYRIESR